MAICPICKVGPIPGRQPGLGGGPLITCKSANCRRLYLLAQTRRNWRTHRDRERIRAGEVHPCVPVRSTYRFEAPDVRSYRVCPEVPELRAVAGGERKGPKTSRIKR